MIIFNVLFFSFSFLATTSLHHASKSGSLGPQQLRTSGHCSNEKSITSSMVMGSDILSKNDTQSRCVSDRAAASHRTKSAANNSPQENRCFWVANKTNGCLVDFCWLNIYVFVQKQGRLWSRGTMEIFEKEDKQVICQLLFIILSVWPLSFILPSRLWDKVAALPWEPVAGRSHFMERMRATVSLLSLVKCVKCDGKSHTSFFLSPITCEVSFRLVSTHLFQWFEFLKRNVNLVTLHLTCYVCSTPLVPCGLATW